MRYDPILFLPLPAALRRTNAGGSVDRDESFPNIHKKRSEEYASTEAAATSTNTLGSDPNGKGHAK
ncbi:hypothetical protein ACE6H2_024460 [Prunus campanulata]